jgi:fatty-acid desaturase
VRRATKSTAEALGGPPLVVQIQPAAHPSTWNWFRSSPGDWPVLFWVSLIHVMAVTGLVLFPLPGWRVLVAAYALFWLGGLGTTVAYHRALAHRSLKLNPVAEMVLIAFAIFNGSGSPATWTANHRFHHANTDTEADISSPRHGFWWAHLRWLWQVGQSPVDKWAPEMQTRYWRFWTRWQVPILGVSLCIGIIWGWEAFFWMGAIRLTASLHAQCFANSISHMRPNVAVDEASSQNVVWLAPVQALQGENWHGNHHERPGSARLGWTWRQIDLGWWTIVALERMKLAADVRRPALAPAAVGR